MLPLFYQFVKFLIESHVSATSLDLSGGHLESKQWLISNNLVIEARLLMLSDSHVVLCRQARYKET